MKRIHWFRRGLLAGILTFVYPGLLGTPVVGNEIPIQDVVAQLTGTSLVSLTEPSSMRLEAPIPGSYLTPRVVPVTTRVVTGDGTRATNFSVRVGTNQYVATPVVSGPGDAEGFHLLALDRATLTLVTNLSVPIPEGGVFILYSLLNEFASRPEVLVIVYEMNPAGRDLFHNPLGVALAAFGANSNALYNASNNEFAPTYAFIGNAGLSTNRSFEVSGLVNPQATGQMDLVLTRDIHGNYFPINPRFVTLQTSTGTGGNTVLVHAHAATRT